MSKKSLVRRIFFAVTACMLAAMVIVISFPLISAEYVQTDNDTALQFGQSMKVIESFGSEAGGVKSIAFTNGGAGGHQQMTINFADGTGSSKADYLQFQVTNPANKPLEMFWFKLYTSAAGYQVQATAGKPYQFYNYSTKAWTDMTIADAATYYTAACVKVPANSSGIVRIPLSSFNGCTAGASAENDSYVFGSDLITALDVYMHIADPDKAYTVAFDNVSWVKGDVIIPEGFDTNPGYDAALQNGQGVKSLTDFGSEAGGVKSIAFTNGSAGGHQQMTVNFADGTGSSKADYLQFQVTNPANKPLEMFWFKLYTSAAGYQVQATAGKPYQFYNYSTKAWTDMTIADAATFYPGACVNVPANSSGIVRIPLSSFNGCTANASAENDRYVFGSDLITALDVYMHIANPDTVYTVTIDNLAWVGSAILVEESAMTTTSATTTTATDTTETSTTTATDTTAATDTTTATDTTAAATTTTTTTTASSTETSAISTSSSNSTTSTTVASPDDGYDDTDDVKLNPGETFKLITGFEDADTITFEKESTGVISSTGANSGSKSYAITYSDGSANGFKSFAMNTSTVSDWSKAKYIQFYVKNTCPETVGGNPVNPLEIFYFEINLGPKIMLNYGATGIKLYDKGTGKWSDLSVTENSFHVCPDLKDSSGTILKCPSLKIPAGFEGYVRIPLSDTNFYRANITAALSNVYRLSVYTIVPGIPGERTFYYDDFGLVSYEGNTAPAYVDDETNNTDPTNTEPSDNPYKDEVTVFTLTGVIKDAKGNVLPNVTVTLKNNSSSNPVSFVTNSKGQYKFEGVKTGWAELSAVGSDGTDYGYITYEITSAPKTSADGTAVLINHNATGLILNMGMDELGLIAGNASEGVLDVSAAGSTTKNDDSTTTEPTPSAPNTGVANGVAVAALAMLILAGGALILTKKRS